jgi:hypothetical protein
MQSIYEFVNAKPEIKEWIEERVAASGLLVFRDLLRSPASLFEPPQRMHNLLVGLHSKIMSTEPLERLIASSAAISNDILVRRVIDNSMLELTKELRSGLVDRGHYTTAASNGVPGIRITLANLDTYVRNHHVLKRVD